MDVVSFFKSYKPIHSLCSNVCPFSDYAASKGGLTGMMKNLSTRLAEHNISVNDVAPAMIGETGMIPNAAAIPEVAAGIPIGRLGTVEETANVVTMLVTTGYMTGQSLLLAGGLK
jgi:3-oxoacyl-[acyl-carrier protein] reductase